MMKISELTISVSVKRETLKKISDWLDRNSIPVIVVLLSIISILSFIFYWKNGLGLAYNDARSHLDIGRRVVEGLKPGLAQLGSVWLPLFHILMIPTVWNDFMWHSGLAGAIQSMAAFVFTGVLIFKFLKQLGVNFWIGYLGVAVFVLNINILYLQSTAMTELLLLATMTAGSYYLLLWFKERDIFHLVLTAFWVMLSTLVRYDGWFMLFFAALLIVIYVWKKKGYKVAEGKFVLFCTLGGFGIFLWVVWNLLIFGDPLYFAFGPYSAHAQQTQLEEAGVLATKGNIILSLKVYLYALAFNSIAYVMLLGGAGFLTILTSTKLKNSVKYASLILISPFVFNVIALYLGHSVLFIQGISGGTWFNVRYGIMMMPALAIFIGYFISYFSKIRPLIIGTLIFVLFFSFASVDAVTIDDARVGSSQKNVNEVSGWLRENTQNKKELILISAASHDSIIFTSGLPMKRFIHEGTGKYYDSAIENPDRWARWIVVRSNSDNDSTWTGLKDNPGFEKFELVGHHPFADIYQLKDEYVDQMDFKL